MGIGLAAAVLIDATIVRAVLLPATMKLLGEQNWYLPALARVAAAASSTSALPSWSTRRRRSSPPPRAQHPEAVAPAWPVRPQPSNRTEDTE